MISPADVDDVAKDRLAAGVDWHLKHQLGLKIRDTPKKCYDVSQYLDTIGQIGILQNFLENRGYSQEMLVKMWFNMDTL